MKQWSENYYQLDNETMAFYIQDVDVNFYACKYIGSSFGFVMDKDEFNRKCKNGRISSVNKKSIAV